MKKSEVEVGKTYTVKVSGKLQPVMLTSVSQYGGWYGINTATKRDVRIRSAAKLRGEWNPKPKRCGNCECCKSVLQAKAGYADMLEEAKALQGGREQVLAEWREFCAKRPCAEAK